MSASIRLTMDAIDSLEYTSIGAAYMGVGSRFDSSVRALNITNTTDHYIMCSLNGIDDHFIVPSTGAALITLYWNQIDNDGYFAIPAYDRLYVKELINSPGQGFVYLTKLRGVDDA